MITLDTLRHLALSLPETTEEPHFEKTSFRVKKKIFAYDHNLHIHKIIENPYGFISFDFDCHNFH